jgi:hypothetical protein
MRANNLTANTHLVIRIATSHTVTTVARRETVRRYPRASPPPLSQPLQPAVVAASMLHISDSQLHWATWSRRNCPQTLTHSILCLCCRGTSSFRPPTFFRLQCNCDRQASDHSRPQGDFPFQTIAIYPQRMTRSVIKQQDILRLLLGCLLSLLKPLKHRHVILSKVSSTRASNGREC